MVGTKSVGSLTNIISYRVNKQMCFTLVTIFDTCFQLFEDAEELYFGLIFENYEKG